MTLKMDSLPSFEDIGQFVKWAELEDALKGLRSQLQDMNKSKEKIVIESGSQTEVGYFKIQFLNVFLINFLL